MKQVRFYSLRAPGKPPEYQGRVWVDDEGVHADAAVADVLERCVASDGKALTKVDGLAFLEALQHNYRPPYFYAGAVEDV